LTLQLALKLRLYIAAEQFWPLINSVAYATKGACAQPGLKAKPGTCAPVGRCGSATHDLDLVVSFAFALKKQPHIIAAVQLWPLINKGEYALKDACAQPGL